MTNSTKTLVALLLAGLAGITVFLVVTFSGGGGTASAKTCQVGEQNCLPDVPLVDTIGKAHTPESLAGKVVIVNFWATWCGPCLKEIPDLSRVYDKYKDQGLVVLGVLAKDDPDNQSLLNFQSDNMMSYPVVRATRAIYGSYGDPRELPTTYIYDRRGKLVHRPRGMVHADQLANLVEPLLAAK